MVMARGRAKLEWDQTALIWSLIANVNRDTTIRPEPFAVNDIHPFAQELDDAEGDIESRRAEVKRLSRGKIRILKRGL